MLLGVGSEASHLVRGHCDNEMAVGHAVFASNGDSEMNPEPTRQARKKRKNLLLVEGERRQVRARQGQHRNTDPSGLLARLLI